MSAFTPWLPIRPPVYDEDIAKIADVYADERVLALYNELVASYRITETFSPSLKVRNYYGSIAGRTGVKGQDYGKDVLAVEALAAYKITENVELRAGIRFENTIYDTPVVSDVLKNSGFGIYLPVGLTIQW
ncbi:MAG: hypothetical protein LBB83_03745 [Treponema sp.]|jgi:hypothetical protein|nr:hypothetical protein [Treponema sp.]